MKNKEKLLVTSSTFPRWENDTEPRFVLDMSLHLSKRYEVTVLAPAAPGAAEQEYMYGESGGRVRVLRYHYLPIHRWETLCYPGAIVSRIKEKKVRVLQVPFLVLALFWNLFRLLPDYDVVHAHWLIPQGIIQSFFGTPYIVTGHGGDVTSLNKRLLRKLKCRCIEKAAYVTVVSDYLKERIRELSPRTEALVLPMGVEKERFSRRYYRENFFGQGKAKVVLFVGRLAEKKGVSYLIEAMKQVDAMLVVVGEGPLEKSLKEQAKEMGDRVRFLGPKSHEELKAIYASADVFVVPSITARDGDVEGLGLVVLEAMSSGVPVVANDSGGIRQLIRDGENGLLCEEKNVRQLAGAINRILKEDALSDAIREKAYQSVRDYDYSILAGRYLELLDRIVL